MKYFISYSSYFLLLRVLLEKHAHTGLKDYTEIKEEESTQAHLGCFIVYSVKLVGINCKYFIPGHEPFLSVYTSTSVIRPHNLFQILLLSKQ